VGEIRRFRSQRVAALLAYLALRLGRDVPREELAEALWPEEDPKVTANRLRVALTSLRHQIEPPGVTPGSVLDASRAGYLRLRRETLWCDVDALEAARKRGALDEAARLATGLLLPGFFDEWILVERERLQALRESLPEPAPQKAPPAAAEAPVAPPGSPHRLPLYVTRFFGREQEGEELARLLAASRLVTVVASGGMGKTRLCVETARGGTTPTVFVPLADLPEPERLPLAVLQALAIGAPAEADPFEVLTATLLRRGTLLLILDNAEHLTDAVSELAFRLLESVPALRLLVTSRQALELPGEALLKLAPLEPPPVSGSAAQLSEFPAVALFLDRARAVHPDYVLSERHTAGLVALCQRLEGIPLALELAAARIHVQTPTQILESLAAQPTELGSRQRALPPRHRSLRAVVESSLALLSPRLREAFFAVSIFQGGWTGEAAAAVFDSRSAEAVLEELLVRSLILRSTDEPEDIARFTQLETLRQFGAEQLVGPERQRVAQRHAQHFLTLLSRADEHDVRTLGPLEQDLENVLIALDQGYAAPDGAFWEGLRGFLTFAFVRGHHRVATLWAERAVADWQGVEPPERRFELLHRALMLYNDLGRWDEIDALADVLRTEANRHDKRRWLVEALQHRSYTASQQFRHEEAVALQREALTEARALDDRNTLIRSLVSTNRVTNPLANQLTKSDPARSQAHYREAEAASREALTLESPHSRYQSNIHMGLYIAVGAQGRHEEAYALLKRSQEYAHRLRAVALLMYSFYFEQAVERDYGSLERAALLFGAFLRLKEQMGFVHPSSGEEVRWREQLRQMLSPEVYEHQVRLAYQLPLSELVVRRTWNELKTSQKSIPSGTGTRSSGRRTE
jgi:predicted ATPase